jgi:hypothetical protein
MGSIEELTERVRMFTDDRDWQQFHTPKNLAIALAREVGELLAELQWLTPEQSAAVMDDPAQGARVRAGRPCAVLALLILRGTAFRTSAGEVTSVTNESSEGVQDAQADEEGTARPYCP